MCDLRQCMSMGPSIRFDRNELAGAFGDIGTDLPLIVAMILAAGLHTPSVLIVFGALQVVSGLVYRMPMPVQPLKAMATLVIAQQVAGPVLLGAGLGIGVVMLLLSAAGLLGRLTRFIPKAVVRGLQLGLGLTLCMLALTKYISTSGMYGYFIAAVAFIVAIFQFDRGRWPASLVLIGLGVVVALFHGEGQVLFHVHIGIHSPRIFVPSLEDVTKGFILLALPQIPLSLGNSIIATHQVARDLYPDRSPISADRIGATYGLMNLTAPFLSGIPCCHGSGGMVGHYAFGGRTGGSVVIYGALYLLTGVFLADGFEALFHAFPLPVLGVILLFEGLGLALFIRDLIHVPRDLTVAMLTGIIALIPGYGFLIAMVVGTAVHYSPIRLATFNAFGSKKDGDREER